MVTVIVAVLIILWLIGLIAQVGGGLLHLLLAAAAVLIVFNRFAMNRLR